jgi:hypothetical protein
MFSKTVPFRSPPGLFSTHLRFNVLSRLLSPLFAVFCSFSFRRDWASQTHSNDTLIQYPGPFHFLLQHRTSLQSSNLRRLHLLPTIYRASLVKGALDQLSTGFGCQQILPVQGGIIRQQLLDVLHNEEGVVMRTGTPDSVGVADAATHMRAARFCLSPAGTTSCSKSFTKFCLRKHCHE